MKPTVIMARHGATKYDPPVAPKDRIAGWDDLPLEPMGRTEAFTLAKYLKTWPIREIVTSDLDRAYDTAHIARALHPDKPEVIPTRALRPQDVGEYTHQLEEDAKDDLLFYQVEAPTRAISGGESTEQLRNRLIPVVREAMEKTEKNPERGAILLIHHSRNFPLVRGWWAAGCKGNQDTDEAMIKAGPQVKPGEISLYVLDGGKWRRSVVSVEQEKQAA